MLLTESYLLKPIQLTGRIRNKEEPEVEPKVEPEANSLQPYSFTSTVLFEEKIEESGLFEFVW